MAKARSILALWLLLAAVDATAKGIDVAADTITRDASGAIVAEGDVIISREGENLKADKVIYDAENKTLNAVGSVRVESKRTTITAEEASMQTENRSGSLKQATATFPEGQRLEANEIRRVDENHFQADDVRFSSCPPEDQSWSIHTEKAKLDLEEGWLSGRHTRFEVAGMPILYTPYWSHSLRRRSGFLMPEFGTSQHRGTEWALPYYLAPAESWDATITPRWMTRRGFMGNIEYRHVSRTGNELYRVEGIKDKVLTKQRNRVQAEVHHRLPHLRFDLSGDYLSDLDYLADLPGNTEAATTPYLQSQASLSGTETYGDWMLMARHQQNLRSTRNNAETLQIAPQFESRLRIPVLNHHAYLLLDQQSTRFIRKTGYDGWRVDLGPAIEIPWKMAGGGINSTLNIGTRHTRYWLRNFTGASAQQRNGVIGSLDTRATFERISSDDHWRHAIVPIIRLDVSNMPTQSGLPNFDSDFNRLTINNLMAGSRFMGRDRVERMQRISMLIESTLQHRNGSDHNSGPARTVSALRVGASYDMKRESVDPLLLPASNRPFSNLLGELMISPRRAITFTTGGQYDSVAKYWASAYANLAAQSEDEHHMLRISWQKTDARYAQASQMISLYASTRVAARWDIFGRWQYDRLLKLTQQAAAGFNYTHPCWNLQLETYRSNLAGSDRRSDYGFRFLLGFKGLGSVGS